MAEVNKFYGGKYDDSPLTDEQKVKAGLMAGHLSGGETKSELADYLHTTFDPFRQFTNAATLGFTENLGKLALGEDYTPPQQDASTPWLKAAGGMVPAVAAGVAGTAALGTRLLAPLATKVPRIAQTVMGAVENAGLAGAQSLVEGGDSPGKDALYGAGVGAGIESPLRLMGWLYAKGLRMPKIMGIPFLGPNVPAAGKLDPTLADPFTKPLKSMWDGLNEGIQKYAEKIGIPRELVPLTVVNPNDAVARFVTHKAVQAGAVADHLYETDVILDQHIKRNFDELVTDLGGRTGMSNVDAGNGVKQGFDGFIEKTLRAPASQMYEDILNLGIDTPQGSIKIRDWSVDASKLVPQLEALIKGRGYDDVSAAPVNKVRNLIAYIKDPTGAEAAGEAAAKVKETSDLLAQLRKEGAQPHKGARLTDRIFGLQEKLKNQQYEATQVGVPGAPLVNMHTLWTKIRKLYTASGTDEAATGNAAQKVAKDYFKDLLGSFHPDLVPIVETADLHWKFAYDLLESDVGKVISTTPGEKLVDRLTENTSRIRSIREHLNGTIGDATNPNVTGDKFVEFVAARKLRNIMESSIDEHSKKLDWNLLSANIEKMGVGQLDRDQYLQELFGHNQGVLDSFKDLAEFVRAIDPARKATVPRNPSTMAGGSVETAPLEAAVSKMDVALGLLLRSAYGGKLGEMMTTMPTAGNPLRGGLRPAMGRSGPGSAPIQLLNTLRQGAGSAQRNVP